MSDATRTVDGVVLPAPGVWEFDPAHSHLEFSIRHMVVGKTRGRFSTFTGTITVAEEPSESSVELTIEAASIDTREPKRDDHLRSPDFLDVANYPEITYKSTAVRGSRTDWHVTGDLTVAGKTKQIELDVTLEGVMGKDAFGFSRAAFSGETELDREDWGLTWNMALEAGGFLIGKTLKVTFEVEAVRKES
jgi:polyisoprenoid-binding protein YceI